MSLIERAQANDRTSWERIVYLYSPLVFAWCRRFGLQDADALDISQDVLRSVFTKLAQFRKERPGDSFRKWLKTITRNRVLDALRRERRLPKVQEGQPMEAVADLASDEFLDESDAEPASEQKVVLRRALDMVRQEFTPRTWNAFWRVAVDEQPVDEVARDLGVSTNVVYLAKSRVIRRLTVLLAEIMDA
jgi:RNA polymerase sigma-70 factor (ECF subfamily)